MFFRLCVLILSLGIGIALFHFLGLFQQSVIIEEAICSEIAKATDSKNKAVMLKKDASALSVIQSQSTDSLDTTKESSSFFYSIECEGVFESYPLSPSDWAIVLNRLYEKGARKVMIQDELSWEKADELELSALGHEIKKFDSCVIGLSYRLVPGAHPRPSYLDHSTIEQKSDSPLTQALKVNEVLFAPSVTGIDSVSYGFLNEATAQEGKSRFLVKQWDNGSFIPSWSLAGLCASLDVKMNELSFQKDRQIILGDSKRSLIINEFGQIGTDSIGKNYEMRSRALSTVFDEHVEMSFHEQELVIISAKKNSHPEAGSLKEFLDLQSRITAVSKSYDRLPLWGMALILLSVGLLALFVFSSQKRLSFWGLVFLMLIALIISALIFDLANDWCPVLPLWGMLIVIFLGGFLKPLAKKQVEAAVAP